MPPRAPKLSRAKPPATAAKPRPKSSKLPVNWPSSLPYYTVPRFSPALSSVAGAAATPALADLNLHARTLPGAPCALVRIKTISDPLHPAHGQAGLFAARTLVAHEWILDYIGLYHTAGESDEHSDYDISLDRESGVAVDAAAGGNEGRFVNDYRGVPGRDGRGANVVFENRRVDGQLRVGIRVGGKEIRKGEELLISYGKGFWAGRREDGGKTA